MATIKVVSPFTVQMEPPPAGPGFEKERETQVPTRTYVFPEAGTYEDVPDDVAEHWYTKSHLEGYKREDMGASTVMKPVEGSGPSCPTGTPQSPPAPADPGAPSPVPQRAPYAPPEPFDTHDQRESPVPDPQPTGQTEAQPQPQQPAQPPQQQQPAQPPQQQQQPAQPRPTQPPPKR